MLDMHRQWPVLEPLLQANNMSRGYLWWKRRRAIFKNMGFSVQSFELFT